MQFFITLLLSNLVTAKRKYKNVCDYYICADSSAVKCRKTKNPPHVDFCSSSRSSCSDSSSRCYDSDRYCDSSSRRKPKPSKKDAVELIQNILACQAYDARFLIGIRENEVINSVKNAFLDLELGLTNAVNASYDRLIAIAKASSADVQVKEAVFTIINQTNELFLVSVKDSVATNSAATMLSLDELALKADDVILAAVKDKSTGIRPSTQLYFDAINETVQKDFASIAAKELEQLQLVFTPVPNNNGEPVPDSKLVAAIKVERDLMQKCINQLVNIARNVLGSSIVSIFREMQLSFDLLFCETNHQIVDIVKQISNGQSVNVPKRVYCDKGIKPKAELEVNDFEGRQM